ANPKDAPSTARAAGNLAGPLISTGSRHHAYARADEITHDSGHITSMHPNRFLRPFPTCRHFIKPVGVTMTLDRRLTQQGHVHQFIVLRNLDGGRRMKKKTRRSFARCDTMTGIAWNATPDCLTSRCATSSTAVGSDTERAHAVGSR